MTTQTLNPCYNYHLDFLRDEIRALLEKGCISLYMFWLIMFLLGNGSRWKDSWRREIFYYAIAFVIY